MATVPTLECNEGWTNLCGCGRDHNYCWPRPDTSCCDRLHYDDETPPEQAALIERMLRMSVEILHGMSGRQFGLCSRTVRPCKDDCSRGQAIPVWGWAANGGLLAPMLDGGQWYNATCGRCVSDCACSSVCEVTLPPLVQSIVQVRLDGVILDPESYRVDNHRKLVRMGTTIAEAEDLSPGFSANMFDVDTRFCFPVDPIGVVNMDPTGDPTPPFCYQSPALLGGQRAVMQPGCQMFTVDVAPGDAGQPIAILGPLETTYPFPASTSLDAGGVLRSGWRGDNTRLVMRYVAGSGITVDENGQFNMPEGSSTFELCLERRSFGDVVDCWPTCQDMSKPATEPGTFEVTYLRGKPVPEAGIWAAGLLACELIKACAPPAEGCECRLPSNVQSVVREGVSIDMEAFVLGGGEGVDFGRTGIPEVDLWLKTVNPFKRVAPSRVYSVDKRRPRRTTWPCDD